MKYAFDKPTKYRISVLGNVNESWTERLAGMSIDFLEESRGKVTVLHGVLRDQAELSGVLNTLYEMHLTLLSVEELTRE